MWQPDPDHPRSQLTRSRAGDETVNDYTFGDDDGAAARLELLARVFASPSRRFLASVLPSRCDVAVDLGCGPGASTALLAEVTGASIVVGLDQSPAFVARARDRVVPVDGQEVRVAVADVTTDTTMPAPPADLLWVRFLLAHLRDLSDVLGRMARALRSNGVLAADELESITTDDDVFRRYLDVTTDLVASRGATMAAGPLLAVLADPAGTVRTHDEVVVHEVAAGDAASMFLANIRSWRDDPHIQRHYDASVIAELQRDLDARRHASDTVTWRLRQIAWTRTRGDEPSAR